MDPITREEMFLSGYDLEPITRREKFLSKLSSGGAQADWNAAEGEPGHVLNRTHYAEVSVATILEETQLAASEEGQPMYILQILPIVEGLTYTVTYNGTEYECVAFGFSVEGTTGVGLGNKAFIGEEDSGEPFAIGVVPVMGATIVMDLTGATSCTVKIEGEIETIHQLDRKFIDMEWVPTKKDTFKEIVALGNMDFNGYQKVFGKLIYPDTEYKVNWNGTEYILKSELYEMGGIGLGVLYIGDSGFITGEASSGKYPFVIKTTVVVKGNVWGLYGQVPAIDIESSETGTIEFGLYEREYEILPRQYRPATEVIDNVGQLTEASWMNMVNGGSIVYSDGIGLYALYNSDMSTRKFIWANEYGIFFSDNKDLIRGSGATTNKTAVMVPLDTAAVGKIPMIKQANGSGVWFDCVDPFVIQSSTEGSTKKFKITVDDSGTLSTVEVTE